MNEGSKDFVSYRMTRAEETLEDARILARAERWNACVNRLYYACFYAVSALLVRDGLSSSKHAGIRGLFNRNYVKTGKIPKHLARIYNDLLSDAKRVITLTLSALENHRSYHGFQRQRNSSDIFPTWFKSRQVEATVLFPWYRKTFR